MAQLFTLCVFRSGCSPWPPVEDEVQVPGLCYNTPKELYKISHQVHTCINWKLRKYIHSPAILNALRRTTIIQLPLNLPKCRLPFHSMTSICGIMTQSWQKIKTSTMLADFTQSILMSCTRSAQMLLIVGGIESFTNSDTAYFPQYGLHKT